MCNPTVKLPYKQLIFYLKGAVDTSPRRSSQREVLPVRQQHGASAGRHHLRERRHQHGTSGDAPRERSISRPAFPLRGPHLHILQHDAEERDGRGCYVRRRHATAVVPGGRPRERAASCPGAEVLLPDGALGGTAERDVVREFGRHRDSPDLLPGVLREQVQPSDVARQGGPCDGDHRERHQLSEVSVRRQVRERNLEQHRLLG